MKTVITYGVFDLFHEGHVSLLERAKALGDRLIVGVATDQYAYRRGKLGVVDPLEKRIENVRSCPCVDQVIVEDHHGQKAEDIRRYQADIFAIGDDWLGKFEHLRALCEVVYLKRTPGVSSRVLLQEPYAELRIGMIGCGRVAERFVKEAGHVRSVQMPCVYHPDPERSRTLGGFLERHTSAVKVRTLDKLFDQTDAVYIASPHETHYAYARAALMADRHVLCEKPLCFSRREAEELFAIAEERGLVLMEAIKTAYCPGFVNLCGVAESGYIGEIVDVQACLTRYTSPEVREWTDQKYGGSFTEFGSYLMLPVVKLFGTEGLKWSFFSVNGETGVDAYTSVQFLKDGKAAQGRCGIGVKSEGELIISGTKGYIIAEAPWWKTGYFEIRREDPSVRERFSAEYEEEGFRYELADFLYRIRGHRGREYKLTPQESVFMAGVFEDFLGRRDSTRV